MTEHRELMARGVFVAGADGLWRRLGTPLPGHLRRTRSTAASALVAVRRPRDAVDDAARLALRLAPPWLWVSRSRGECSVATPTFEGEVLLLAPGRIVARTMPAPGPDYADRRRRYARHVHTPGFSLEDGLLVEEFVDGRHFDDLGPRKQVRTLRKVVAAYARLTRAESAGDGRELLDEAVELVATAPRPASFPPVEALRSAAAHPFPLVPSAADPQVRNVVVTRRTRPVVIDLPVMILAPFLAFPLGLLVSAGPPALRAYHDGAFDDELARLLAAAGSPLVPTEATRRVLLALWASVTTRYEARRLGVTEEPDRVGALLAECWDDVEAVGLSA
jgi:hypothetical protein